MAQASDTELACAIGASAASNAAAEAELRGFLDVASDSTTAIACVTTAQ